MTSVKHLLDVNVLIALSDPDHVHNQLVARWFAIEGQKNWGVCPFIEAGFLRLMTNPTVGGHSLDEVLATLSSAYRLPGFVFWPIRYSWATLTAPFAGRIFGHQQVTDAYLLGLAIKENGVLVTLDSGLKYLAGAEHCKNLLVLS